MRMVFTRTVLCFFLPAIAQGAVTILDDGERIARDLGQALPSSPWPGDEPIHLFALREETVAFQVVVEASERTLTDVTLHLEGFTSADASNPTPHVEIFAERFIHIRRPSGNNREAGSLAFKPDAAPDKKETLGWRADPLVPRSHLETISSSTRGAFWVDIFIPKEVSPAILRGGLVVRSGDVVLARRSITLDVLPQTMNYPIRDVVAFYEPETLKKRLGSDASEEGLRRLLHAHRINAMHDVRSIADLKLDELALSGTLFSASRGYVGAGESIGERFFTIGAYGSMGAPSVTSREKVATILDRIENASVLKEGRAFLYAVDESCDSPLPRQWKHAASTHRLAGLRILTTCGEEPSNQAADAILQTTDHYRPVASEAARRKEKWVGVYNGIRPHAGAMMLDVPATDLRANGWIQARYQADGWFYWESTFWLDNNRGGLGGELGHDPYVVAETFHNKDGDYANGDGILFYPGIQLPAGMHNEGENAVYPSIRLKNIRRGIEDMAYFDFARQKNADAAERVMRRMIPHALSEGEGRPGWPERGAEWLRARTQLLRIVQGGDDDADISDVSTKDSLLGSTRKGMAVVGLAALLLISVTIALRKRFLR